MIAKFISTVFFLSLCCSCISQSDNDPEYSPIIADSSLTGRFQLANGNARDFSFLGVAQAFWYFSDSAAFGSVFPKEAFDVFLDTVQTVMQVMCDCKIKSDTIYVQGGLGYVGALGFDLKISKNLFTARTMLSGSDFRIGGKGSFVREIYLKSARQSLRISDPNSLKPGQTIIGQLIMESIEYEEKAETSSRKMLMKILFKCPLGDVIL